MAEPKTIVVTGIPGAGSTKFTDDYADSLGSVKVYHTGEMAREILHNMPNQPRIPIENIQNLSPLSRYLLGNNVFDNIGNEIEAAPDSVERIVVDTHAQFRDKNKSSTDYGEHMKGLNPDLFLTLIDKSGKIKDFHDGKYSIAEVLDWQNDEVNMTQEWANNCGAPMYIIPAKQEPETVESLLENDFLVYFQMPMTDANGPQNEKISEFEKKLRQVGVEYNGRLTPLLDPRHIDIGDMSEVPIEDAIPIEDQTIHRDLNWYVNKATTLVAYYPPGSPLSKGVSDESTRGFETGKDVFVVVPGRDRLSPFMRQSSKVFTDEQEFFNFFPEYMDKRMQEYKREK